MNIDELMNEGQNLIGRISLQAGIIIIYFEFGDHRIA